MEEPMIIRKSQLSRADEGEYLRCLQTMKAEGMDVAIPDAWLERSRFLDIVVLGGTETFTFDLPGPRTGLAIQVRLVARRPGTLLACEIVNPLGDDVVLDALLDNRDSKNPLYRLGPLVYPEREVLNSRIEKGLPFHGRNQMVEGVILASGLAPIPEYHRNGMTVPFTLVFLDQNENEIRQDAELFVDRTWKSKSKLVYTENSLRAPGETPDCSNFNINRSRVPAVSGPDAETLKNSAATTGPSSELDSEAMASLKKALNAMAQPPTK
jgi:hypothetical protein